MKFTQPPDYSGVLLPSVPVDVAANAAPLVRGAGDPTAATGNGRSYQWSDMVIISPT